MTQQRLSRAFVSFVLVMGAQACALTAPPNAAGPRGNVAPYPVLLAEDIHRTEAATAAINHLTRSEVATVTAPLQLITSTIKSLPANTSANVYLPKVGANPLMNEEETREALRRFIRDWQIPIGADPAKLSLVDRIDQPDGSKIARYEQRAFRYPIRGDYGQLEIRFAADRRVLNITSTCIPDADKIQTALAAVGVKLKPEDAVTKLLTTDVAYSAAGANKQTFHATAANQPQAQELVTFITPAFPIDSGEVSLVFQIAWQINLTNAPVKSVYVDAVTGDVVAP